MAEKKYEAKEKENIIFLQMENVIELHYAKTCLLNINEDTKIIFYLRPYSK